MAAGISSRFGGLKQVEPVGPNGEFILDYSVYDAIRAGYSKVVFVINKENYELFRNEIGKKIESKVIVKYVFQELSFIPLGIDIPEKRVKPWGTAHAILSCKNVIDEAFVVINADDFYGFDPYVKLKKYMDNVSCKNEYAMIGYSVKDVTIQDNVLKRGICTKNDDDYLESIIESFVLKTNGKCVATSLKDKKTFKINDEHFVSMNMWGFSPTIFNYLEDELTKSFYDNKDNLSDYEFFISDSISNFVNDKKIKVKVLSTSEKCYGITYKEDKESLVKEINEMIKDGKYHKKLWD